MIKENCVRCGNHIGISKKHYLDFGNYCRSCHAEIVRRAEKRLKSERVKDLYDKYQWAREERAWRLPDGKDHTQDE